MRLTVCTGVAVILSSCGVSVPNPEGCLQLTRGDAACRTLFTEGTRRIPKSVWQRERIGTICYQPEAVGNIINFIEQVCNRGQNCVSDWERRLDESLGNMNIRRVKR